MKGSKKRVRCRCVGVVVETVGKMGSGWMLAQHGQTCAAGGGGGRRGLEAGRAVREQFAPDVYEGSRDRGRRIGEVTDAGGVGHVPC